MGAFRPMGDGKTFAVSGMRRSPVTGRYIIARHERTPDEAQRLDDAIHAFLEETGEGQCLAK